MSQRPRSTVILEPSAILPGFAAAYLVKNAGIKELADANRDKPELYQALMDVIVCAHAWANYGEQVSDNGKQTPEIVADLAEKPSESTHVGTGEAAGMLGYKCGRSVQYLCEGGTLAAEKVNGQFVILRSDVHQLRSERLKTKGIPQQCQ